MTTPVCLCGEKRRSATASADIGIRLFCDVNSTIPGYWNHFGRRNCSASPQRSEVLKRQKFPLVCTTNFQSYTGLLDVSPSGRIAISPTDCPSTKRLRRFTLRALSDVREIRYTGNKDTAKIYSKPDVLMTFEIVITLYLNYYLI